MSLGCVFLYVIQKFSTHKPASASIRKNKCGQTEHFCQACLALIQIHHHGSLVTIRKFAAVDTITPHLMGQRFFAYFFKSGGGKKSGIIRKHKQIANTQLQRLGPKSFNKLSANTSAYMFRQNRQCPNFSQPIPSQRQSPCSDKSSILFGYGKIPQSFKNGMPGSRQYEFALGIIADQIIDSFDIRQNSFT